MYLLRRRPRFLLNPLPSALAQTLPIEPVLPELLAALASRNEAVLQAPPGAGKTTRVPLALLDQAWLRRRKIVLLEPRRLAARASARRMASMIGEQVGETVGYRVRGESRAGPRTRIEVVTEGILIRMLQDDPALEGVGCVLFDEYHERGVLADLGLAMTLDARSAFREDLRLLVMSATLDGERVAGLLDDAPVITSSGRQYPVETHYLDRVVTGRIEGTVAPMVREALSETDGDILVFLPGVGEIRRTQEALSAVDADIRPLYGALGFKDQDYAIRPSTGRRKVVLSTDIAETSLTIEGIRTVIDSGLARRALFDPASGMSRLVTVSTSVASADQRRGRAGRLGPGTCYRLWTRVDHAARKAFDDPEVVQADLASLVLELAVWGAMDPSTLRWLDPPPPHAVDAARELLIQLGALAPGGPTAQGREMNRLGMHPRLAHLVSEGRQRGLSGLAVRLAALLEERDVLRGYPSELPTDLRLRVELLAGDDRRSVLGAAVDGGGLRRVRKRAGELRKRIGKDANLTSGAIENTGLLVAAAYPDRLAQRIRDGHFRLRNGRPVTIPENDPLAAEAFLAVATVGGGQDRHRAFLAAPISVEEIEEAFQADITTADHVYWDEASERVHSVRRRALDSVVLAEAPLSNPNSAATAGVLLEVLRNRGSQLLPWDRKTRQLQDRLAFLHRRKDSRFPDRSDSSLLSGELLLPYLSGMTRLSDLRRLDLHEILLSDLDWPMRQELDTQAPTHLTVPSGSRLPLDYSDPESVVLAVRLQEVFGLTETPRVAGEPVTMRLLSPAQRPVQITQDLAGFWATSYFDVRKDLRGRYPKHYWPENPLDATPTARAKPRKR